MWGMYGFIFFQGARFGVQGSRRRVQGAGYRVKGRGEYFGYFCKVSRV